VKQSLEKQPSFRRDTTQNPTSLELIPAASFFNSGKSPGNPVVELATPNGTNNLTEGTNKNGLKVKGRSNPM
jgi:hypothetical protein